MSAQVLKLNIPTMLTINETVEVLDKYAKDRGATNRITKFRLRQLALTNEIIHTRAGKKILINLDKLIDYLNSSGPKNQSLEDALPANKYGITPITCK